jgi:hypothetical protein
MGAKKRKVKEPRRIAVIISNGTFSDSGFPRLLGTTIDNKELSMILSDPELGGFEVNSLVDQGLLAVRKAIALSCSTAERDDTLLIYYSGTGALSQDGNLYLPVADSESSLFFATAIEADFVLSQLRNSPCRRIVLIIDGCHSGAFFQNNRGIPDGMIAVTACSATEYGYETPEGGAFTRGVIEGLTAGRADRDNDGKVSVDELYEFVKEYVRKTDFPMHPQKWVWNLPEPIFLVNVPRPVFISYARENFEFARMLSEELEINRISTWVDKEGIKSGQDWLQRIASVLDSARCLLLVLSPHSLESKWVRRELEFADKKGIQIIPVLFESCELPSWFELQFGRIQRHMINRENFKQEIPPLIDSIHAARRLKSES